MKFIKVRKAEDIIPGYYMGVLQNDDMGCLLIKRSTLLYKVERVARLGDVYPKDSFQKDLLVAVGEYVFDTWNSTPLHGIAFFLSDYGIYEHPHNNHKMYRIETELTDPQKIHRVFQKEIEFFSYDAFYNLHDK